MRDSSWNVWGFLPPHFHAKKKEECPHLHLENIGDKSQGDNEAAIFVCSSCHITITEESQRRRVSREKESMKQLREQEVNFSPKNSADKGLTIGFLFLLCEKFNLWDVSTRDVVLHYVVPMTSHLRCRFVDLPIFSSSGADVIGRADTFVSHCNQERFGDLVAGLIDGGADFFRKVWIDIFAVRQWPSFKHDMQYFEKVIELTSSFLIVFPMDYDVSLEVLPVGLHKSNQVDKIPVRCLYELICATSHGKPIVLKSGRHHLTRDTKERVFVTEKERFFYKLLPNMEMEKATATNEVEKAFFVGKLKRDFNVSSGTMNEVIRETILTALKVVEYPVIQTAACGDAVPRSVLKKDPDNYLLNIIRAGSHYTALLSDLRLPKSKLLEWRSEGDSGLTLLSIATANNNHLCIQYLIDRGTAGDDHASTETAIRNALRYADRNNKSTATIEVLKKALRAYY